MISPSASLPRLLDPVDQFALVVGLAEIERDAEAFRMLAAARLDLRKAFAAVSALGIEPVEIGVGPVEKDDAAFGHWQPHLKDGCLAGLRGGGTISFLSASCRRRQATQARGAIANPAIPGMLGTCQVPACLQSATPAHPASPRRRRTITAIASGCARASARRDRRRSPTTRCWSWCCSARSRSAT